MSSVPPAIFPVNEFSSFKQRIYSLHQMINLCNWIFPPKMNIRQQSGQGQLAHLFHYQLECNFLVIQNIYIFADTRFSKLFIPFWVLFFLKIEKIFQNFLKVGLFQIFYNASLFLNAILFQTSWHYHENG